MSSIPNSSAAGEVFVFPASFSQERLWFLDQLTPGTPVYNVAGTTSLATWLDVDALERSLNEIVRRHEALRTTFAAIDGQPMQLIAPTLTMPLRVIDLQHLSGAECQAEAERLARAEAVQPFDLAHGPLLRALLLRRTHDHLLVLVMHHIISDGWSIGIFFSELTALYETFSTGRPSLLPEIPLQYADFAEWQHRRLQGETLARLLSYWREQLQDPLATMALPADHARPPMQSFRGALETFTLSAPVMASLKALSQQESATLFMALLAAFKVLLQRYTRLDDVVVGSPIANRNRPEIEGIIGFFVNTLILRTDLSGNPSFRELLRRVREVTLGAYSHQDLPFEKLVEELKPERRLNHNPLFQVMFVFQNIPTHSQLVASPVAPEITTGTAKFDLTMILMEMQDGLSGVIEYNTDIFEADRIKRAAQHFVNLVESIAQNPDRRIGELALLSSVERRLLLVEWNHTERPFPAVGVHQLVETQAMEKPDAVAAVFKGERLTFRELDGRANQLAHRLQANGVGLETVAGVCLPRSLDMLVAVLAVLKAGAAYLPLDPGYPSERLAFMLSDTEAPVLLTTRELSERFPGIAAQVLYVDEPIDEVERAISVDVAPENLAYVIYTSGSTGRPKGVAMTHRSMVNMISWHAQQSVGRRTLQFAPLSFDVSFQEIFTTWSTGGTVVLITEAERLDSRELLRLISSENVERLFLPPVALQQLAETVNDSDQFPAVLREVITAGEQLTITPNIVQFFTRLNDCVLRNHYGPTETHVVSQFTLDGDPKEWPKFPAIGRAIANVKLYVLDRELQPVPVGVPGEIYAGGVCAARGYLQRPALTAERFVPNPFSDTPGERLYNTGDLVRYRAGGDLEFIGRIDQQVKLRGFRIEPGEIELVLVEHPSVRDAVVGVYESDAGYGRLVAHVVPQDPNVPASDELRNFLRRKVPEYMIPSAFEVIDTLPLTASGKVDRNALPSISNERPQLAVGYVAPRTPLEESLATIYSQLLGLDRVGIHDSFFNLGGHSLLATQLVSRVRSVFRVDVPLPMIFEAPTVAELALLIVQKQIASAGSDRAAEILARLEAEYSHETAPEVQQS
jgi:amino acid adenylation domain-containing protein